MILGGKLIRRIWNKHDASISLAFIVLGLAVAGVGLFFWVNSYATEEVGPICTPDIVTLSPPVVLMPGAIDILVDAGLVPSVEAALESLVDIAYVFDPGEDYELELWLYFVNGEQITAAEFNMGCVLEDHTVLLEYEGSRVVG